MAGAFIGTSGFDYKEWKPDFYPADLPRRQFLSYYATRFPTVDMKASRRITHLERLRLPSETLRCFLQAASELKHRLGPLLFQLPPFFKNDFEKLSAFLEALPREIPAAFEFRRFVFIVGAASRRVRFRLEMLKTRRDASSTYLLIPAARTDV